MLAVAEPPVSPPFVDEVNVVASVAVAVLPVIVLEVVKVLAEPYGGVLSQ